MRRRKALRLAAKAGLHIPRDAASYRIDSGVRFTWIDRNDAHQALVFFDGYIWQLSGTVPAWKVNHA